MASDSSTPTMASVGVSVDLPLDYGLIVDSRAADVLRTTAQHSLGIFKCNGDDLHMDFLDATVCDPYLQKESKAINDAYAELDPSRDCLILFDKPVHATVNVGDQRKRMSCKALAIVKRRSTEYRGLN
jgi:hypothetical protein